MGKKPERFYRQSAVIPYRKAGNKIEIMLITSIRKGRWVIPKGIIEPGLSAAESARKEALEEAGIIGDVSSAPIGKYSYAKWGGKCKVKVFPMKVNAVFDRWPEEHVRKRLWMTVKAAADAVREPELRKLILALPDVIAETRR
ncbi:MAG: NUDIX hydrolase [Blastocatellia bacterium]|nr:NUDIX hydrolase [Blastocatellia bacterium]